MNLDALDDEQLEHALREKYISPKSELLIDNPSERVSRTFAIMKARQRGILQTLDELKSVMSYKNIVDHVLNYIPDLKYVDISTNNKKTIKKKIIHLLNY